MKENEDQSISQEPPKTDTTPKTDPTPKTDTVAPQNPDEITLPSKDQSTSNANQQQSQAPSPAGDKSGNKEKKGFDTGSQDPRMKMIEELSKMVEEINDDVTDLLAKGAGKLKEKFKETELGKECMELKNELAQAKDRLGKAATDALNEKWNELKTSEQLAPIANTLSSAAEKVSDMGESMRKGMVSGVKGLTEGVKQIAMDSPKSSDVTPTQSVESSVNNVDDGLTTKKPDKEPEQTQSLDKEGPSMGGNSV
ncbi:hypothetical protein [Legionella longbeachae]|uniref:Putative coiled-coil protein n=1 Tax=Legionella longbeachae serogroup 1 (strain NSW150) TaxID=661367 RepID=D3HNR9_LEGLN|nr:hypothetical protein [Legionella longbeachae]VEE01058.1 coiled-coil protein [Legionella oakridgensis]HBD7398500.1 hypothetical protein [Legionella pneumophila]ARB92561.1 hypothetical protein A6J40_10420 [Legionella longbeachae]ARM34263.1 hypothetical protein B0B39_12305 [Legionella longbeachae]EEZ96473.1 hypothetical protein LLB_1668 [Legionella longbeachae D-4968]